MPSKAIDLKYTIGADLSELERSTDKAITKQRQWKREMAELEAQQHRHRQAIGDLGQGMATFGAVVAVGLGMAAKAAIEWESAFAGVRKTVDGSDQEIAALEGELRQLAKTLPATHAEIAAVAEAAGQLGIKRKDIAEFTKTMVDLGETTNLSADEAATALAKFSNIMGTSASDVDRLGSALVALGNDGASTEQDIIAMGLRIAAAGNQVGMTEAQILGFASALSSVGIEAEAGGSSFSTAIIKMAVATRSGGEALEIFARVAGVTTTEFAQGFGRDASGAMILFIQGLRKMQDEGGDTFGTLNALGLSENLVRDALLRAAGASEMFTKSIKVGSEAWAENTALVEEAEKRYQTTESRMRVAGNQIKDAMIDIGAAILPAVAAGTQGVSDMVRAWSELPGPLKDVVAVAGAAAVGITLVGGAALVAYPRVLAFRESMTALAATGGAMGGALGKFGLFMAGPWGLAITAGVTLLGLFAAGSGAASREQQQLAEAGRSVAEAIREQNGAMNDSVRAVAAKAAAEEGLLDLAKGLHLELPRITDAILEQGSAYDALIAELDRTIDAGTILSTTGQGAVVTMNAEAVAATDLKAGLEDLVGGKNAELQATEDTTEATKESSDAAREQSAAVAEQQRAAEAATTALKDMIDALDTLNGVHLTAREAHLRWIESIDATRESLAKNGATLDGNTVAGRENIRALDAQAKAANDLAAAAAREAEATGGATAGIVAFKGSLEASRPALYQQALAFYGNQAAAKAYVDQVLGIPSAASTHVNLTGIPAAQASLDHFIFSNQGRVIGVRIQTAYGPGVLTPGGSVYNAQGNIVSFAGGGHWENHAPQIVNARPGTVRMWAEPDTDRESYIPWAMDRRSRATAILAETARGFGYDLALPSQPAWQVAQSSYSRTVDASTNIHGDVIVADYREFEREREVARRHALFSAGVSA